MHTFLSSTCKENTMGEKCPFTVIVRGKIYVYGCGKLKLYQNFTSSNLDTYNNSKVIWAIFNYHLVWLEAFEWGEAFLIGLLKLFTLWVMAEYLHVSDYPLLIYVGIIQWNCPPLSHNLLRDWEVAGAQSPPIGDFVTYCIYFFHVLLHNFHSNLHALPYYWGPFY